MTGERSPADSRSRDRDSAAEHAVTGLVLAGGRSRRMGVDKATLVIDDRRLVDRAVTTLAEVCGEVLVASGTRTIEALATEQLHDDGSGPLAGIVAGLRRCTTPLLAVLAVDMPAASPEVFRMLLAEWSGEACVAPRVDGVVQPLHAVYATPHAQGFAAVLAGGERSPTRALERLGALVVDVGDAGFALNLNWPADRGPATPRAAG